MLLPRRVLGAAVLLTNPKVGGGSLKERIQGQIRSSQVRNHSARHFRHYAVLLVCWFSWLSFQRGYFGARTAMPPPPRPTGGIARGPKGPPTPPPPSHTGLRAGRGAAPPPPPPAPTSAGEPQARPSAPPGPGGRPPPQEERRRGKGNGGWTCSREPTLACRSNAHNGTAAPHMTLP